MSNKKFVIQKQNKNEWIVIYSNSLKQVGGIHRSKKCAQKALRGLS